MHRNDRVYLLDILEASKLAVRYLSERAEQDLLNDIQLQDAVIRRIEIIGEAARRVSQETRSRFTELPWIEMIRMRNLVIHEYNGIDLTIVWDTVQNDLPPLIERIQRILSLSNGTG